MCWIRYPVTCGCWRRSARALAIAGERFAGAVPGMITAEVHGAGAAATSATMRN